MNYVFFGSPMFAEIVLQSLIESGMPPALVVCNPDRPVGRRGVLTPPLAKVLAEKHGILTWQPDKLEIGNWKLEIAKFGNPNFAVVAAYAKIIPQEIIDFFPRGLIGVHPSLLPKYRGATPIQSSILEGEQESGVTLFLLDEKVDHGHILVKSKWQIANKKYLELEKELAEIGGTALVETIPKYLSGEIVPKEQNHDEATFTKKFSTEGAFVEPEGLMKATESGGKDAVRIERMIRAFNPEPGTWTKLDIEHRTPYIERALPVNKRIKLLESEIKNGKLVLNVIHVEGKKPVKLKT